MAEVVTDSEVACEVAGEVAAPAAAASVWRYRAPAAKPTMTLNLREGPDMESGRVEGAFIQPKELFEVIEERPGQDGVIFLKLADGRGWAFDRHAGVGVVCVRQEEIRQKSEPALRMRSSLSDRIGMDTFPLLMCGIVLWIIAGVCAFMGGQNVYEEVRFAAGQEQGVCRPTGPATRGSRLVSQGRVSTRQATCDRPYAVHPCDDGNCQAISFTFQTQCPLGLALSECGCDGQGDCWFRGSDSSISELRFGEGEGVGTGSLVMAIVGTVFFVPCACWLCICLFDLDKCFKPSTGKEASEDTRDGGGLEEGAAES